MPHRCQLPQAWQKCIDSVQLLVRLSSPVLSDGHLIRFQLKRLASATGHLALERGRMCVKDCPDVRGVCRGHHPLEGH